MNAECGKCGLIFASVSAFDMHRVGKYCVPIMCGSRLIRYKKLERRCLTPLELKAKGMVKTKRGWATGRPFHFESERKT